MAAAILGRSASPTCCAFYAVPAGHWPKLRSTNRSSSACNRRDRPRRRGSSCIVPAGASREAAQVSVRAIEASRRPCRSAAVAVEPDRAMATLDRPRLRGRRRGYLRIDPALGRSMLPRRPRAARRRRHRPSSERLLAHPARTVRRRGSPFGGRARGATRAGERTGRSRLCCLACGTGRRGALAADAGAAARARRPPRRLALAARCSHRCTTAKAGLGRPRRSTSAESQLVTFGAAASDTSRCA